MADVFGDLEDRAAVLATLDRLREDSQLYDHQLGLSRLVRYREDRNLQEAALQSALEIRIASELLVAEALNALVSKETPLSLRIAAARAAGHLLARYKPNLRSRMDPQRAYETLEHVAAQRQPPSLADSLREALEAARPAMTSGPRRDDAPG